ncbi:MAG TPA: tail fiber domain-containing protein, partial [Chitinophagales bacterium]|nr:tail fiber domain-containing protein [Chitinophagales bacterium]
MKTQSFKLIAFITIAIGLFSINPVMAQTNTFPTTGAGGIGTTTPNASSLLDITSTTKGMLVPRMTKTQRDAIATPATGLLIYQTNNTTGFYYYSGTAWTAISAKGANTSLSNLVTTTAINSTLLPNITGSLDLGSPSLGWRNQYLTGKLYIDGGVFLDNSGISNTWVGATGNTTNTGSNNTATGSSALHSNTSGIYNTANGLAALYTNTTGNNNSAMGPFTLFYNSAGSDNTALGFTALYNNTADGNTAIGSNALFNNSSGTQNVAVGKWALNGNTLGSYNTASGYQALYSNNIGTRNTAMGVSALYANTSGEHNSAVGTVALYSNTTGYSNTACGTNALYSNTMASQNTAIGMDALKTQSYDNGSAWNSDNVAIGTEALYSNQSTAQNNGIDNTAVGNFSMRANTTGYNNTSIGLQALYLNTTGISNTATGMNSLYNNSTGILNTSMGVNSLLFNTTGSYNTAIGENTGPVSTNYSNTTCLGTDAAATATNTVRIGNVYVNSIGGQVGWTTLSDGRFKENVNENVPGLSFINQLRPITYQVNRQKVNDFIGVKGSYEGEMMSNTTTGFIAQEVEQAAKKVNFNFSGVDAPKNDKDYYGLRYAEFVVPLVKAVQELSTEVNEKDQTISDLQTKYDALANEMKNFESALSQCCTSYQ